MQKTICLLLLILSIEFAGNTRAQSPHSFNEAYKGRDLDMIAFPIGGLGAGMFCLDGTGTLSHLSIRNTPDVFNTPRLFAAMSIKGSPEFTRVLEGPVPGWKRFSVRNGGHGVYGTTIGLARFREASFKARFPFGEVDLTDTSIPVSVKITGWSPFIPNDADHSSLPVGGLEYEFTNTSRITRELIFSFNSYTQRGLRQVVKMDKGFVLSNDSVDGGPDVKGDLAFYTDEPNTVVDYCWFRGGFYDALNVLWKQLQEARIHTAGVQRNSPGASLFVPFTLRPGEKKKIRLMVSWYVPDSKLRFQDDFSDIGDSTVRDASVDLPSRFHKPWYSSQFASIGAVTDYWRRNYDSLRSRSMLFRETFYKSTLPAEVIEAVTANFSTLKSPTILRQYDGRLWAWEGCEDEEGSCPGSCTHVWNYAQAIPHLFPSLERGLRETEFFESQNVVGHQQFRSALPIRPTAHNFYAAADGQLGGVMKVYRDWRIGGDSAWLRRLFPRVRSSLDYCIRTWDPGRHGKMEEPHHNTYDVEFWGADGMTQSYYLGALEAFIRIGEYLREDVSDYQSLLGKARSFTEDSLYNGQYFVQKIQWKGLKAADPVSFSSHSLHSGYSPEALVLLQQEGPKYQYGTGCLSDGVAGDWLALVCGLPEPLTKKKVVSHLESVYRYNFRKDLSAHSNPDRPGYALGNEGGLLLCSWPLGSSLSLPFVFSTETWTGIEYEVASHLIFEGKVKEGLDLVKACRRRYDGQVRNPFDEYECGHWYARALSSYALLEALTGVRYDAVSETVFVRSRVGNFVSFLSTDTGWGNVIYKDGKVTVDVVSGRIPVKTIRIEKETF